MIEDIIKTNRSYRRFHEDKAISKETLRSLINLARFSPSAGNIQPLKYMLFADPVQNKEIFPCLAWAGYLTEWSGPGEGERPSAYIVILGDTELSKNFGCDHGIAAQSILLGAVEKGMGGCMIGAINRNKLRETLNISERYEILMVLALGYPNEKVVVVDKCEDGSIKYYRDSAQVHYVPKRTLDELIITE